MHRHTCAIVPRVEIPQIHLSTCVPLMDPPDCKQALICMEFCVRTILPILEKRHEFNYTFSRHQSAKIVFCSQNLEKKTHFGSRQGPRPFDVLQCAVDSSGWWWVGGTSQELMFVMNFPRNRVCWGGKKCLHRP